MIQSIVLTPSVKTGKSLIRPHKFVTENSFVTALHNAGSGRYIVQQKQAIPLQENKIYPETQNGMSDITIPIIRAPLTTPSIAAMQMHRLWPLALPDMPAAASVRIRPLASASHLSLIQTL